MSESLVLIGRHSTPRKKRASGYCVMIIRSHLIMIKIGLRVNLPFSHVWLHSLLIGWLLQACRIFFCWLSPNSVVEFPALYPARWRCLSLMCLGIFENLGYGRG